MNSKKSFGIFELYKLIIQRKKEQDTNSQVYRWLTRGEVAIGKKVIEEAVETVLASHDSDKDRVCSELCDLLLNNKSRMETNKTMAVSIEGIPVIASRPKSPKE